MSNRTIEMLENYIIGRKEFSLNGVATHDTHIDRVNGRYYYIPFSFSEFEIQLNHALKLRPDAKSFIDVGCGIGTKLSYVGGQYYWKSPKLKVYGIEVHEPYIEIAKKLAPKAEIIKADALEWDYEPYDIIYFYCPLSDYDKERKLEKLIFKTAKKGTIILANNMQLEQSTLNKYKIVEAYGRNILRKE